MESHAAPTDPGPTAQDARAALTDAESARQAVAQGVDYPPAYLPLTAFSGASLPLLMAAGSDGVPSDLISGVFVAVGLLGVVASGWALSLFESRNGLRITGLRSGRRLSLAFITAMLVLLAVVAAVSHGAGAWWSALIAAPVGGAISVVYARAWLADYRRTNA